MQYFIYKNGNILCSGKTENIEEIRKFFLDCASKDYESEFKFVRIYENKEFVTVVKNNEFRWIIG